MQNHSTGLDQTTWGIHLNSEGHFTSPPNPPSWLTQLQQQDWQRRGVVLWDADHRIVAHLYAGYALEMHAALCLREIRDMYRQLNEIQSWDKLIAEIRERFRKLPALQDELNQLKL